MRYWTIAACFAVVATNVISSEGHPVSNSTSIYDIDDHPSAQEQADSKEDNKQHHECSIDYCTSKNGTVGTDCLAAQGYISFPEAMTCGGDDEYKYPRVVNQFQFENRGIFLNYTCCTVDDGTGYYIKDVGFWAATSSIIILALISFVVIAHFTIRILATKEARSSVFNLYLALISLPDATYTGGAFILTVMQVCGYPLKPVNCFIFGITLTTTNLWINAVIAHEVYILLYRSSRRMRTKPPSTRKAKLQAIFVFLFVAGFRTFEFTYLTKFKQPLAFSFLDIMSFIPMVYVLYIVFRVWYGKMLPMTGRTRDIAMYFGRILLVFYGFLLPGGFFFFGISQKWGRAVGAYFFITQGLVSVAMARKKEDVREATLFFTIDTKFSCFQNCCCRKRIENPNQDDFDIDSKSEFNIRGGDTQGRSGVVLFPDSRQDNPISANTASSAVSNIEPLPINQLTISRMVDSSYRSHSSGEDANIDIENIRDTIAAHVTPSQQDSAQSGSGESHGDSQNSLPKWSTCNEGETVVA